MSEFKNIKLMTQTEVAKALRCSETTVKRLRLSGRLAYIPGRPVMIEESAVSDYLNSVRIDTKAIAPETPAGSIDAENARLAARRKALARRFRS